MTKKAAPAKADAIPEVAIRLRCIDAAARAMMRGPANGELPGGFAASMMGLGNAFYAIAATDPAIALPAIESAALAMANAKPPMHTSAEFGGDVLSVATSFYRFASGKQDSIGHDPMSGIIKK